MKIITSYNLLYLLGTVEVRSEPLQWYSQGSWNQHEYETAVRAGQHFVSVTNQIKTKLLLINHSCFKHEKIILTNTIQYCENCLR